MLDRLERTEGLATIYPAMMNSIFALLAEARDVDDPLVHREIKLLERYEIEDERGRTIRVQPCISPVWDTAIAMVSLEEAGLDPSHPALVAAERWVLKNQILGPGDWQVKNKRAAPGGWAFEFQNDFYPDVDDTAFVLMALGRVADPDSAPLRGAIRRSRKGSIRRSRHRDFAPSAANSPHAGNRDRTTIPLFRRRAKRRSFHKYSSLPSGHTRNRRPSDRASRNHAHDPQPDAWQTIRIAPGIRAREP